jgi:HlyD family secretion protein
VRRLVPASLLIVTLGAFSLPAIWPGSGGGDRVLRLHGEIDVREARPGFDLAGRIAFLEKEEGDRVREGEPIGSLEDTFYRAQEAAARARLEAARARLAELEAGSRPQEIERARAEVAQLEALLRDADLQVGRLRQLVERRASPQADLDTAVARRDALAAQLEAARQTLSLLIEGPRRETIAAQRAEVARAEAELAAATKQLVDTVLVSQVSGVVTGRLQEPGDVVLPQTPIYTIALDVPVYARVWAPEPELGWLREGLAATILTDSGGRFAGRVGYVSPVAEFTPKTVQTEELRTSLVYEVRVYAEPGSTGLRQGMPVTVEIERPQAAPAS